MGFKKVCKNAWGIIIIIIQTCWLVTKLLFLIPPILSYYSIKRMHLRRRIKRRLMSYGMPPKLAMKSAKQYTDYLADYASIRGVYRIAKTATKSERKLDDVKDSSLEIEAAKSYSFAF